MLCLCHIQAEVGGPLRDAVETELEFVRAEGCDEGFSGEVSIYLHTCTYFKYMRMWVAERSMVH